MAMITLKEYAERHGKDNSNLGRMAKQGRFKTAIKMGRDWFIDENEPFVDTRIKSGKYIGWRKPVKYVKKTGDEEQLKG